MSTTITLAVTRHDKKPSGYGYGHREEEVDVEIADFSTVKMSTRLAAAILRAAADELDPQPTQTLDVAYDTDAIADAVARGVARGSERFHQLERMGMG